MKYKDNPWALTAFVVFVLGIIPAVWLMVKAGWMK